MPTFRDLYDKLASLSQEQLDCEIKVIPVGYTDGEAAELLTYDLIPQVLEISKASRNLYHCNPGEDAEWMEAGIADFSEDEVKDMGIDQDEDYKLICRKGETFFKIKDNISVAPAMEARVGDLDTSILHL